jgi:putative oxidoreductase
LGWKFVQTGWGKLHNLDKDTELFTSLGIPAPGLNAVMVGSLEFGGGILLMLGLCARLISVPLTCSMFVAFITADREALMGALSDPDKFDAAAPVTFLVAVLVVFVFGPGKLAIDHFLFPKTDDRS